jgi:hypothetical protein
VVATTQWFRERAYVAIAAPMPVQQPVTVERHEQCTPDRVLGETQEDVGRKGTH